jgi:hypothetical protein
LFASVCVYISFNWTHVYITNPVEHTLPPTSPSLSVRTP